MSKKVVVFVADGTEDIEATVTVDVLRRAGAQVTVASAMDNENIEFANGIKIIADCDAAEVDYSDFDMIVLPGGMPGTTHLGENKTVCEQCKSFAEAGEGSGKWLAAICAAPTVFGKLGLLEGKNATCYPGCEEDLIGANYTANRVELDGNIITGNGPGSSFQFAYRLVYVLFGKESVTELTAGMQYK